MKPPRRILIGAASFSDAESALWLARRLAARMHAVVGGLLVEEDILRDLPRLGRQRVVTVTGRLRDVPTARQVARALERDAEAFQAALSELAAAAGPLERRRGELTVSAWEAAKGWDVLVFGQRQIHTLPGQIVLVAPPAGAKSQAAALAEELAQAIGTTVVTLGLAPEPGAGVDEVLPDAAALLDRVGRLNCAAVVLDRAGGPFHTAQQLRALLDAARCPVVLVGKAAQSETPPGQNHAQGPGATKRKT